VRVEGSTLDAARAAKSKAQQILAGLATVNGVGITRVGQGYGVKVNLSERPPDGLQLPDEVDGVPVIIEVVGRISKRQP
jgi:hypothetical protein